MIYAHPVSPFSIHHPSRIVHPREQLVEVSCVLQYTSPETRHVAISCCQAAGQGYVLTSLNATTLNGDGFELTDTDVMTVVTYMPQIAKMLASIFEQEGR